MSTSPGLPLVVALRMGYGHLRPAHALAGYLGVPSRDCDHPPLADDREARLWHRTRELYEGMTRLSTGRGGGPLAALVEGLTKIAPLEPMHDRSGPDATVRGLDWLGTRGLGAGTNRAMRETGAPLLATHFAPALLAAREGLPGVHLLVTDSDIHRIWAPPTPATTRITYFAPSPRVVRRLAQYGVPAERVIFTGFPLPHELVGGPDRPIARQLTADRIARLDRRGRFRAQLTRAGGGGGLADGRADRAPRLTFAVGGAGGQVDIGEALTTALASDLRAGRLLLTLVAGVREKVAARLAAATAKAGVSHLVEILFAPDHERYFVEFNELLARTDVLWTKPSELSFFAALGLPIIGAPPVGAHEGENLRWLTEQGAGVAQCDPAAASQAVASWLDDGTLAGAAWNGFMRLPGTGLYEIAKQFGR